MTCIAVTQRVVVDPVHGTRSDALDQRWWPFLRDCGLVGMPVPNDAGVAVRLVRAAPVHGILLTGGNDLAELGGDAPERDRTETALLDVARERGLPVVAVCRGMQLLLRRFGVPLQRVSGHVAARQTVTIGTRSRVVNSYHNWAASTVHPPLRVWATGPGRVVKAVRHETEPLLGLMWHPERLAPDLAAEDRQVIREQFGGAR
ncbi:putative glutamine amidotransferase [Actinoplanes campanulatus]|uniref:Putative glutamine amidotransferase n=1 Tax=Actinoplanes campanulatus TaxID=113559 RepID=A0A7W5ADG1_9ACTN|nr:gamma-glutamyl-gamma-aminobutyrate hydrolase family protein [Actinoplanes campanulatus]MBB3094292.1 putative glutamine amidotransferase [Actinoplanes campanulatus]GGN19984.1 glutamine amidotransferase [Actinoplanes campanulatus]GID35789.1 glutamine amidotransferase [Actinoplanes campanulatus]